MAAGGRAGGSENRRSVNLGTPLMLPIVPLMLPIVTGRGRRVPEDAASAASRNPQLDRRRERQEKNLAAETVVARSQDPTECGAARASVVCMVMRDSACDRWIYCLAALEGVEP